MMASEVTATKDQNEDSQVDRNIMIGKTLSDVGQNAVMDSLLEEQCPRGTDGAMKTRKPYTITKQRERWSEEEHDKFLEALKLYGRAWRKIEEHVGTKTAVQIRSHAQKFFSKVARESTNEELSSTKPIQIPPPRPKRKPVNPYPRKSASPLKAESPTTPNLSVPELENQSPTAVLSAIGSEFHGSTDSSGRNSTSSPISSAGGGNFSGLLFAETAPPAEPSESPSENHFSPICVSDNQEPSLKLELFPENPAVLRDGIADETTSQTLKLFGKTVLVTDSNRPSHLSDTCKSASYTTNDGMSEQNLSLSISPTPEGTCENQLNVQPQLATPQYAHFPNGYTNLQGGGPGFAFPWWGCYGIPPFFNIPLYTPAPARANPSPICEQTQIRESKNSTDENEQRSELGKESDEKVTLVRPKALPDKPQRGFLPYKKRWTREKDTGSSTVTGDESEEKRIRL